MKRLLFLICLLLLVALAGYAVVQRRSADTSTASGAHLMIDQKLLKSLRQQPNTNPAMAPSHLASSLMPPTNRWFSGIVFGDTPQPIYPLPLAFKPSASGFTFNQPAVVTKPDTIFGSFTPDVSAQISQAATYNVSRYDEVSLSLEYVNAQQQVLGSLTLAEGSPYIFYQASQAHSLTLAGGNRFKASNKNLYSLTIGSNEYGVVTGKGASFDSATGKLTLPADGLATFFAVPKDASALSMSEAAAAPLTTVKTTYQTGASETTTTLEYRTATNQPTLYAALPHQKTVGGVPTGGYYDTIYGRLPVYRGNAFSFVVPAIQPQSDLAVGKLSTADKTALITQLKTDATATNLTKTDSYFGGKELYRAANLYNLAMQLKQPGIASSLHDKLTAAFAQWLDPNGASKRANRYFYYDTTVKGLVAAEPSFGSQDFNDHHFHYGYFLYAAGILAQHDPAFERKYGSFLNLIASDIASPQVNSFFPIRRTFDPYAGHSWASGNGQFADGNNQESSSEAINAWNGLGAWANASHNKSLVAQAAWMLSNESASAQKYWTNIDSSEPIYQGFNHPIVALNWGGKRDFATFFSPAPTAALGIQLIPFNPAMSSLAAQDHTKILNTIATITGGKVDAVQFSDYILMYQSLADPNTSPLLQRAQKLSPNYIDDANSRTYLLAWIMTHRP